MKEETENKIVILIWIFTVMIILMGMTLHFIFEGKLIIKREEIILLIPPEKSVIMKNMKI